MTTLDDTTDENGAFTGDRYERLIRLHRRRDRRPGMTAPDNVEARALTGAGSPASRQVNWYETFAFASRVAAQHGVPLDHRELPIAGTLQWCGMADDDARKLMALVLGGVRDALANDAHQDALAQAGEAISAAEDWSKVSRDVQRRHEIDEHRRAS